MPASNPHNDVFFPKVAGLKSALPEHQVAWQINKSFDIQMGLNLEWVRPLPDEKTSLHRHYYCYFEDVELHWHLIKNKGDQAYFFQSNPLFDYLLICQGEDLYNYFERAVNSINEGSNIDYIYNIPFQKIPSKNLFFDNFLNTKKFLEAYYV
jgi:hypothetical protein